MNIRAATAADAAGMVEIYAPIVRDSAISFEVEPPDVEEFAERIRLVTKENPWLVGVESGLIAGYAYATVFRARPAYNLTRESSIYVHPEYQGRGLATELMSVLLDDLSARGIRRVVAGATLPNPASVALHQSLGFEYVGTFHQVGRKFDRWHDVGFWELDLTARATR